MRTTLPHSQAAGGRPVARLCGAEQRSGSGRAPGGSLGAVSWVWKRRAARVVALDQDDRIFLIFRRCGSGGNGFPPYCIGCLAGEGCTHSHAVARLAAAPISTPGIGLFSSGAR